MLTKSRKKARKDNDVLHYTVIISWSRVDEAFIVEVPELPGCMTHGETYQEAIAMAEDAMRGWLAVARESGRPIPKPRSTKIRK